MYISWKDTLAWKVGLCNQAEVSPPDWPSTIMTKVHMSNRTRYRTKKEGVELRAAEVYQGWSVLTRGQVRGPRRLAYSGMPRPKSEGCLASRHLLVVDVFGGCPTGSCAYR